MPPNTIRQNLTDRAKRGIINFKLSRPTEEMGNWKVINYVLEGCNDDKVIKMINRYLDDNKKEYSISGMCQKCQDEIFG